MRNEKRMNERQENTGDIERKNERKKELNN